MPLAFRDRNEAGQRLAKRLRHYAAQADVVVLGLPRGGVPVAFEVARALGAPLDVFVVRKLGVPGHQELAMGAIASGGVCVINDDVVRALDIAESVIQSEVARELGELERRERAYRDHRPARELRDRTVILVDDGLSTRSTMRAAVAALRMLGPARIVVAVPIASPSTYDDLRHEANECVCDTMHDPFYSVGLWYEDFVQTTDHEVCDLLERSTGRNGTLSAVSERRDALPGLKERLHVSAANDPARH